MELTQVPRRARELGIVVGSRETGPWNAITDVAGVRVGHTTLVEGDDIRTGVTAIVPDQLDHRRALPAGLFVGNGHGKMVGSTQLAELGEIETPVLLTATLSTFRVADALVSHMLERPGRESVQSLNPIVAETNDGYLSDIRARPITAEHVYAALETASAGLPAEGSVGAGTGTGALGFKGGIGTASRSFTGGTGTAPRSFTGAGTASREGAVTVGVLVQSNFSGVLRVLGVPIPGRPAEQIGNSCVIVVATDGRFDARQLSRLARRAVFAMGRVGADFTGGSGDYAIAFSTAEPDGPPLPEAELEPAFAAVLEAVEEALLNSLFMATTTTGFGGHTKIAVSHERVLRALRL